MIEKKIHIDLSLLEKEVRFTMSTSSGNGGQNVNRVATKATLHYPIGDSELLTELQKETIREKLKNRINKEDALVVVNQEGRSAEQNKKNALTTLKQLLMDALKPPKIRKKYRVPKANREKRLSDKKIQSEKKALRRKIL
ncbi:MAG: alternative ribosome rescue aminoacyl-tRNA hydrolase ArfB [Bacteroidota bacterium]